MAARGRNTARGWRISKNENKFDDRLDLKDTDPASYDDISVFVIPLCKTFQEQLETIQYPVHSKQEKTATQPDEVVDNNIDDEIIPETDSSLEMLARKSSLQMLPDDEMVS